MRDQLQNVVAAIAQGNGVLGQTKLLGNRLLQLKAVAIGVATQILAGIEHGLPGLGAHAKWILIRSQLDDLVFTKAKPTGNLTDRSAALIRRDGANVIWCALSEIVGHQASP